jgi:protein TonB
MSSFSERKEPVIISEPMVCTVVRIPEVPIVKPTEPEAKAPNTQKDPAETPVTNAPPVVTATPNAVVNVPTNTQVVASPVSSDSPTGTAPSTGTNVGGSNTSVTIPASTGPVKASELDRQPNYPGGIQNFYQYVVNNFDRVNLEEGETIRVNVSFVIETDGTMTDIQVREKTNSIIAKEAVRVLKSLKKKWTPGIKDGQPVRTQFTLPIAVSV